MYYISNYKKRAIDKIIPYLIQFPQIVSIVEQSADRYQAIEDVIWQIANNFKVDDARGVFLQALAHNEVTEIVYTDKAEDAFTYGTQEPLYQAYGAGHYYSQASYISGIKKDITDEKTIRAVKSKIIQNNTNCSIEDLIECLKLNYNANSIKIYESYPLNISLMLEGDKLEISSSGNREVIKKMLPACVALNNIYVNSYTFDIFKYDENCYYGDTRYPVIINETTDSYKYISQSVTLESEFKEYLKLNYSNFDNNMYCCIVGSFTQINPNAVIFSSRDTQNNINFKINENNYFTLDYNNTEYTSNIQAKLDTRYNFILSNKNNEFNLYIFENMNVYGNNLTQDISFITNIIKSSTPSISIKNFDTISAPIYINCDTTNDEITNFCDFTYYAIIIGDSENTDFKPNEYYVSCFGEKQILFNCFENKNHLYINTQNPLVSNILTRQSYFNYKDNHSNGRYAYFDGKSGINYRLLDSDLNNEIKSLFISFDVCMPVELSTGNIITDFVSNQTSKSKIYFDKNGVLFIEFPSTIYTQEGEVETYIEKEIQASFNTENPVIEVGEYANFSFEFINQKMNIYKNNVLIKSEEFNGKIYNIPSILRIAYDEEITNPFLGFIRNINIKSVYDGVERIEKSVEIDLPLKNTLRDKNQEYEYVNYGVRFITTPQLMNDTSGLDLYGNSLIGKR